MTKLGRGMCVGVAVLVGAAVACGGSSDADDLFGDGAGAAAGGDGGGGEAGTAGASGSTSFLGGGGAGAGGAQTGGASGSGTSGTSGASGAAGATGGAAGSGTSGTGGASGGTSGTGGAAGASAGTGGVAGTSGGGGGAVAGSGGVAGSAGATAGSAGAGGKPLCPGGCAALDTPCKKGVCDVASNSCVSELRPPTTPCDDGNACTVEDQCGTLGQCKGKPKDCSFLDQTCVVGICNALNGQCAPSNQPDQTLCDDGNPSTKGDVCKQGKCVGNPDKPALALVELATDKDYVRLRNVGSVPIELSQFTLFIDNASDSSEASFSYPLPARQVAPGADVYVIEAGLTAKTGDIQSTKNFFFNDVGASVWLCLGACSSSSIVDVVVYGTILTPVPPPVTFDAPLMPKTLATLLRTSYTGVAPSFHGSDWTFGSPTHAY